MKVIWTAIKRFFLPPPGTPVALRLMPFAVLGVLTLTMLTAGAYVWDYTNSTEFCGTSCHTMPPEYSAYLRSPHARVQCVECHIGRDFIATRISRKAGDLRHVVVMVTQDYEYPIHAKNMRPARETCETCHFPEKFSDDSLRELRSYQNNEANTPQSTFLVLKTGGGSQREGLGLGIHWHIESEVYYLATDDREQEIPYVRVVNPDGTIKEYYDLASGLTPNDVAGATLQRMDCITCHNRVTHSMPTPEEAVSEAIKKQLISTDLPFIYQLAVEAIDKSYEQAADAIDAIDSLPAYYQANYPEVYASRQAEIDQAVFTLKDIYNQIVFPDQLIDWDTHPNNLGHKDDPGCFRCHDGKHLTSTQEAIRLECNLCHAIPVISKPGALTSNIEIVTGQQPASHTHSSWIALHGKAIDSSCAACHTPSDPKILYTKLEGKPPIDTSFCGNEACHGADWEYIGLNAPELTAILDQQLYILLNTSPFLIPGAPQTYDDTFKAVFDGRCIFCHSGIDPEGSLDLSTYTGALAGGSSGPGLVPGDPAASPVFTRQTQSTPHFGKMLGDELEALQAWIQAGAPEK